MTEEEKENSNDEIPPIVMWVLGIIAYPFNFYWLSLTARHDDSIITGGMVLITAVPLSFFSAFFILIPIYAILGLIKKKAHEREKKKKDCEVAAKSTPGDQNKLKILRAVPLVSASVALYRNIEVTEALVRRSIPNDRQGEPELVNDVLQEAKKLVAVVRKKHKKFASMRDAVDEVVEAKKHLIGEEAKARLFRSLSQADLPKGD